LRFSRKSFKAPAYSGSPQFSGSRGGSAPRQYSSPRTSHTDKGSVWSGDIHRKNLLKSLELALARMNDRASGD
jgi:hypothetical protein